MTDTQICAGCKEAVPLNLCVFFIPLQAAAIVRKEGQDYLPREAFKVFAAPVTPPPSLEQSELFLLCKNCTQCAQTQRESIPELPPFPATISFMTPLKLVTPQLLSGLYKAKILVHINPRDAFRTCFGVNLSYLPFINFATLIYMKTKQSFENAYKEFINQDTIRQADEMRAQEKKAKEKQLTAPVVKPAVPLPPSMYSVVSNTEFKSLAAPPPNVQPPVPAASEQRTYPQSSIQPYPLASPPSVKEHNPAAEPRKPSERFTSTMMASYPDPYRTRPATAGPLPSWKKAGGGFDTDVTGDGMALQPVAAYRPTRSTFDQASLPSSDSSLPPSSQPLEANGNVIANPLFLDVIQNREMFVGPYSNSNWVIPQLLLVGGHPLLPANSDTPAIPSAAPSITNASPPFSKVPQSAESEEDEEGAADGAPSLPSTAVVEAIVEAGVSVFVELATPAEDAQLRKSGADGLFERAVMLVREDTMAVMRAQLEKERAIQRETIAKERRLQRERERIQREEAEQKAEKERIMKGLRSRVGGSTSAKPSTLLKSKGKAKTAFGAAEVEEDETEDVYPPSSAIEIPKRKYSQDLDKMVQVKLDWADGGKMASVNEGELLCAVDFIVDAMVTHGLKVLVYSRDGHGRTGTLAALVLGRLFRASSTRCLAAVYSFHSCRGEHHIDVPSPQTHEQRLLVHRIISEWTEADDQGMAALGDGSSQQHFLGRPSSAAMAPGGGGANEANALLSRVSEMPWCWAASSGLSVLKAMADSRKTRSALAVGKDVSASSSAAGSRRGSGARRRPRTAGAATRRQKHH